MKYFIWTIVFSFAWLIQATAQETDTPKTIRVLIIDDHGSGYYHMPTGTLLRDMLNGFEQVEAVLFEDAEVLGTDLVFDYDVLLLHFKNYRPLQRDEQAKINIVKYVNEGGGLFVFHFACGAFEYWPEYEQYIGRIWDPKKPPHDPYGAFTVHAVDRSHPIMEGISDFVTSDELYTCLKDSNVSIQVLAESVSKVDGKVHPMIFTLEKGKGRVFHTTLGHDAKSLSSESFQKIIRQSLHWLAEK